MPSQSAAFIAPYLTHAVSHHGQVTLVPPDNAGRVRQVKPTKNRTQQRQERSLRSEEDVRFNTGPRPLRSPAANRGGRRSGRQDRTLDEGYADAGRCFRLVIGLLILSFPKYILITRPPHSSRRLLRHRTRHLRQFHIMCPQCPQFPQVAIRPPLAFQLRHHCHQINLLKCTRLPPAHQLEMTSIRTLPRLRS